MRLLTLLLLLGSSHGVFTQLPEIMEEEGEEESGATEWTPPPEEEPQAETYWSGTAPVCVGGCRGRHHELKRDRCGDSNCCWFGFKSLCRVNCGRPDVDFNGVVYGNDWWVGSVVRYDCRSGFMLVGDPTRACQSNGRWTLKPSCLRVCHRGRVEMNEKDIDGNCSSSCPSKTYIGPPKQGCSRIDNCSKKELGWNRRWFTDCDYCQCDCSIACASAV